MKSEAELIKELENFNPRKTPNRSPKRNLAKKSHNLHKGTAASTRRNALMPLGVPRYVRCYKAVNYADQYTVCFIGRYGEHPKEWIYVSMSERPRHPQGVCMFASYKERIDYPSYRHLGVKISFTELPEECKSVVIEFYAELWRIKL